MKRIFEIEYPDILGRTFITSANLLTALHATAPDALFTVSDLTGDGEDTTPSTIGVPAHLNKALLATLDKYRNLRFPDGRVEDAATAAIRLQAELDATKPQP
jgi:hypothetical protein